MVRAAGRGAAVWCVQLGGGNDEVHAAERDKVTWPMQLEGARQHSLSPPGHADKLPALGRRCDCAFEWRCLPHDICFIHDSCLCDGSGSYPPVKPPRDWSWYSCNWYVDYAPLVV
jgi:hypothetical protein